MSNGNPLATTGGYYNEKTTAIRSSKIGEAMMDAGDNSQKEE